MERLKKKICYIFYWKGSKVVKILLFKNDEKPGKKPYPKYIIAESTNPWHLIILPDLGNQRRFVYIYI